MIAAQFIELYLSGLVKRHHTNPSDAVQTIGHHSWGVAVILEHIYPDCSKAALLMALWHDVPERWTGDAPGYVKWQNSDLSAILARIEDGVTKQLGIDFDLAPEETVAIKIADLLELAMFCRYRIAMGDSFFLGVQANVDKWFTENHVLLGKFPNAVSLRHRDFAGKSNPP